MKLFYNDKVCRFVIIFFAAESIRILIHLFLKTVQSVLTHGELRNASDIASSVSGQEAISSFFSRFSARGCRTTVKSLDSQAMAISADGVLVTVTGSHENRASGKTWL